MSTLHLTYTRLRGADRPRRGRCDWRFRGFLRAHGLTMAIPDEVLIDLLSPGVSSRDDVARKAAQRPEDTSPEASVATQTAQLPREAKIRTPPACPTESSLSVPRDGWEESQVFSQLLLSLPSEKTYMSPSPEGNAIFSPGELRPVLAAVVVVVVNLYW